MSTRVRPYIERCGGCLHDLLPGEVSGSTWTRRALCESCAMLLDGLRFVPDHLSIFPEGTSFACPQAWGVRE